VFDGMIAASPAGGGQDGRLYLATKDGQVLCMAGK